MNLDNRISSYPVRSPYVPRRESQIAGTPRPSVRHISDIIRFDEGKVLAVNTRAMVNVGSIYGDERIRRDNDTSVQPQPRLTAGSRNGGGSVRTTERWNSYEDGTPPSVG
ncbi:MAG: hypothetical protein ACYCX2_03955 [Christensenellales bacterium]